MTVMGRSITPFVIAGVAALIVLANTFFVVSRTEQALVLQIGGVQRVINAPYQNRTDGAGLFIKAPFIQNVVKFDRRNLNFNLAQSTVIAADQEQLMVDAFARWTITDPVKFYTAVRNEDGARRNLDAVMAGSLRRVLGGANSGDIISSRRAALMIEIRNQLNAEVSKWGMAVIDVRIRQADFPDQVAEQVYERMRTERQQVAARLRAEGDESAAKIRAEADRTATVTVAEAREASDKIRGLGEAKRAAIFSSAYNRDPSFASFYRSLQAYEKALPKGTTMVLPPNGEFFKYLNQGAR
jgi:membrane protease subunit HflC